MGGGGGGSVACAFWRWASGPAERRLLELLSYGLVALGAGAALLLCFVPMPYGRYSRRRFGPLLLPARPAWALQELPSLLVPLGLAACGGAAAGAWPNRLLLGCFVVHYAHRALIYPLLIREGKPTPLFTFVLALLFCVYNGYLQGRSLSNYAKYPSDWLKGPCFITGIYFCLLSKTRYRFPRKSLQKVLFDLRINQNILPCQSKAEYWAVRIPDLIQYRSRCSGARASFTGWLIGMAINIHSDHILRNLRKPGETGYKIPRGGMFEYVSGANFFGEILEWFGFALACCTIESLAFALCTLFILGSRAKQHHQWYLEKFEDYPKCRKIVIPFVY